MKKVTSTVAQFPGYVVLYDPLPLIKQADFEDAMQAAREVDTKLIVSRSQAILLPGLLGCVAEWHLENMPDPVTPENFPGVGTSIGGIASARLINFLIKTIVALYAVPADADPNS